MCRCDSLRTFLSHKSDLEWTRHVALRWIRVPCKIYNMTWRVLVCDRWLVKSRWDTYQDRAIHYSHSLGKLWLMFYMTFTNLCSSAVENQTRKIVTMPKVSGCSESGSVFLASGDLQGGSLVAFVCLPACCVESLFAKEIATNTRAHTNTHTHLVHIDTCTDNCGH